MLKKILLLGLFSSFLFSGTINWTGYAEALRLSDGTKPMFIFVSSSNCSYCKKEMNLMESNPQFVKFLNTRFVPVYINQSEDYIPQHLISQVTPTFYLTNEEGVELGSKIIGAQPLPVLIKEMNKAEFKLKGM